MSDWITHIGVAYGPGRWWLRREVRLVLVGAVLPDAATPLVVLANNLRLHPGNVEAFCQPLQAPVPTLLLATAIALLTPAFGRSLLALAIGATVHYALDLTQVRYGGGIYLLYPASFWNDSAALYWPESVTNLVLLAAGAVGMCWALVAPGPRITWRWRPLALLPAAVALALPIVTWDRFYRENVNNVDFFRRPEAFEGRQLFLSKLELETVERDGEAFRLTVRKGDRVVAAQAETFSWWGRVSQRPPRPGKRLSFRGVYRDGRIRADEPIHVHFRPLVTWTSLAGMVILILLVLPGRRR